LEREGSGGRRPAGAAFWGRRAAVMKSTRMTRTADDTTRGEGRTMMTSNESSCSTMQGNHNGGNNDS
jgi:hypothetical protein